MTPVSASTVVARWKEAARGPFYMPRDAYLPKEVRGTPPIHPEGTDLEIWKYDSPNTATGTVVPYAIAFAGKQAKPLWNYRFRNDAARDHQIAKTIEGRLAVLKMKTDRQKERREFKHEFNVGDVLYASWGYDQTNIDFYEVTKILSETMIVIRKISKDVVHEHAQSEDVMPAKGHFIGPELRKKVSPNHSVKLTSYSSAYRWDGKPKSQTAFGFGH